MRARASERASCARAYTHTRADTRGHIHAHAREPTMIHGWVTAAPPLRGGDMQPQTTLPAWMAECRQMALQPFVWPYGG